MRFPHFSFSLRPFPHGSTRGGGAVTSLLVAATSVGLVSCVANRPVDLESRAPTSTFSHRLASVSLLKGVLLYGNWGGPGNLGGEPIDAMDELFRRHDLAYYLSRGRDTMRYSDLLLIEELRKLDPDTLDDAALRYRKETITYFESDFAHVIGKPPRALIYRRELPGSVFAEPEILRRHMQGDLRNYRHPRKNGSPGKLRF